VAFDALDMAAAADKLGVEDLEPLLAGSKALAAAWERGRLLKRVWEVASQTVIVPEAADKALHLPKGTFSSLYARDRVVRDLWNRGRDVIEDSIQRGLVDRVKEGDPKAVAAVEHLFGRKGEHPAEVDFKRISPTQMEAATGYPRMSLHRWSKENGLARNADGTFSLPVFIAWLVKWERDKVTGSEKGITKEGQTALEYLRRAQADELRGRLWDRARIVAMFTERAARIKQLFNEGRAKDWSHRHEGHTQPQLEQEYKEAFVAVWSIWKDFPDEIDLPPEARAKIEEALGILMQEKV